MTDSSQGLSADAAACRTQGQVTVNCKHLRGDESGNCEDCGYGQGPQAEVEASARPSCDHEDGGDSPEEIAPRDVPEHGAADEEQIADIDGNGWNLRNIKCFVELTAIFVPTKVRRYFAFVLRPLAILLCLMVTRQWRCSLWPLTELKVSILTLITHLVDVELTVDISETKENMREVTQITLFVAYLLSVLAKLLFSVWQFFKCQLIAKMMWDRLVTPANMDTFEIENCLVCIPSTLPYLYESKTCTCMSWGPQALNSSSYDLIRSCARAYGTFTEEEQGGLNQMQHMHGAHMPAFLFEYVFAVFVWMCALYVAVLVTMTVFKMILEAVIEVLTLYTSYTMDRRTGAIARSKVLHDAVQQCLRDQDSTLLDRTKWCLHQLTSRNRGGGAADEPAQHHADE